MAPGNEAGFLLPPRLRRKIYVFPAWHEICSTSCRQSMVSIQQDFQTRSLGQIKARRRRRRERPETHIGLEAAPAEFLRGARSHGDWGNYGFAWWRFSTTRPVSRRKPSAPNSPRNRHFRSRKSDSRRNRSLWRRSIAPSRQRCGPGRRGRPLRCSDTHRRFRTPRWRPYRPRRP
jgi:hypothetical protein